MNLKSLRRYNLSNEIVRIWWESHLGGHCWVPLNNVIKRSFPIQIPNELWYSTSTAATGSQPQELSCHFYLRKIKVDSEFSFSTLLSRLSFRSRWCPKVGSKIIRFTHIFGSWIVILLPKFFWPTARKNCSSDREKLLKFQAEGRQFGKFLRSLEQFIQTVKGQNNFW